MQKEKNQYQFTAKYKTHIKIKIYSFTGGINNKYLVRYGDLFLFVFDQGSVIKS